MECTEKYDVVRNTQIALYKSSGIDGRDFDGLIELFSPESTAEYLGLNYQELEDIPGSDPSFEVAGMLDRTNRTIYISRRFPVEQRRLTGLHEIIHWILHKNVGRDMLHRDRPITHSPQKGSVEWYELEATNVACQWLMTEKMVRERFAKIFHLPYGESIEFDENTAFFLGIDIEQLRRMDLKQRAMLLATSHLYGNAIVPLHQQFKVSATAMAIRLQELELLAADRLRGKPSLSIVR